MKKLLNSHSLIPPINILVAPSKAVPYGSLHIDALPKNTIQFNKKKKRFFRALIRLRTYKKIMAMMIGKSMTTYSVKVCRLQINKPALGVLFLIWKIIKQEKKNSKRNPHTRDIKEMSQTYTSQILDSKQYASSTHKYLVTYRFRCA